jgi:hypothetical protein
MILGMKPAVKLSPEPSSLLRRPSVSFLARTLMTMIGYSTKQMARNAAIPMVSRTDDNVRSMLKFSFKSPPRTRELYPSQSCCLHALPNSHCDSSPEGRISGRRYR